MKFDEMTKGEIKKFIRSKQSDVEELRDKIAMSQDAKEIRSMGETLKALRDEINEAEEALSKQEDEEGENMGGSSRGVDITQIYNLRGASFKMAHGGSGGGVADSLSLRSDEKLASRFANTEKLDLGKYIRGMVSGDWTNAENERRAMTTSGTGVLIPQALSAEIIDTARNISLFTASGVPVYPMTEGNMTIARVSKDPVFKFKAEGAEQAEGNDFELDSVDLKAKTAYGYCYVSREAIMSAKNLRDIIHRAFAGAMADCIDKGMLYGQDGDSHAPSGVMNDEGIHVLESDMTYGYYDYVKAVGKIRKANGNPTVMAINAETEAIINNLTDSIGQPLNMPNVISNLTTVVSNQLNSDAETGNDALVFDPQALMIGMQNLVTVRMFDNSDYCIKNNMVGFQVYCMLDSAVVRPSHIAKISGIKDIAKPTSV